MTKIHNSPIFQTDARLSEEINRYGCYEMCLLFIGQGYSWKLTPAQIMTSHEEFRATGFIGDDCYVKHPDRIIMATKRLLTGKSNKIKYVGKLYGDKITEFANDLREDEEERHLIMKYRHPRYGDHFVVDHLSEDSCFYDPWLTQGYLPSWTRQEGKLRSARGFIEYER